MEPLIRFELTTRALRKRLYAFSAMIERRKKPYFNGIIHLPLVSDWSLLGIVFEFVSPFYPQQSTSLSVDTSGDTRI